jgi:O-antigen/teichoic acid export membrane protein
MPLVPGYVATFIRHNADRVVLKAYMGLSQLGVYSMVASFSGLIALLVHDPFMKTWAPKRMEICNTENGSETITRTVTLHVALMLFAGLLLSLEIPLLLKILTPSEFWVPAAVAVLAVFSRIVFNVYYHAMFGLLYGRKTFKLSLIQIMTAFVSILLNLIFIRLWGILGAFIAVLLVNLFQCVVTYYMAQPYYRVRYEWKKIVVMTLSSLALFGLINVINIQALGLGSLIDRLIYYFSHGPIVVSDSGWKLKVVAVLQEKSVYIIEGLIKAILSLSFILVLIRSDVIPKGSITRIAEKVVPCKIVALFPKWIRTESRLADTMRTP